MRPRTFAVLVTLCVSVLAGGRTGARDLSVANELDRYLHGEFDSVLADIDALADLNGFAKNFDRDARAWIAETSMPAARAQRELVAATVALEAARLHEWNDWKRIVRQPKLKIPDSKSRGGAEGVQPADVLQWSPSARLVAWGSNLFATDPTPRPIERWWQLAAVAVAERSEDFEFLSADRLGRYKLANTRDEIAYLSKLRERFPKEMRFVLAEGIATEWHWPQDARTIFDALKDDVDVGPEATMRLGAIALRQGKVGEALPLLGRADRDSRDPYVVFLARILTGRAFEQQAKAPDAEAAYRGALAAIPHAQSATVSLAALLFQSDRRSEAARLTDVMLAAKPQPADPWREYAHGDDRFWPELISRLRAEIHP